MSRYRLLTVPKITNCLVSSADATPNQRRAARTGRRSDVVVLRETRPARRAQAARRVAAVRAVRTAAEAARLAAAEAAHRAAAVTRPARRAQAARRAVAARAAQAAERAAAAQRDVEAAERAAAAPAEERAAAARLRVERASFRSLPGDDVLARVPPHELPARNTICDECGALNWREERSGGTARHPLYGVCCQKGKVKLPLPAEPPQPLQDLRMLDNERGRHFRRRSRTYYNSIFQKALTGARLDRVAQGGGGPPVFCIRGTVYHLLNTASLPREGAQATFGLPVVHLGRAGRGRC
eukprot:1194619-Prorocentrum_minimum.AAC.7